MILRLTAAPAALLLAALQLLLGLGSTLAEKLEVRHCELSPGPTANCIRNVPGVQLDDRW